MAFISGKNNKVSTRKTVTAKGTLTKGAIKFVIDNNINNVEVSKRGSTVQDTPKAKRELGQRLEAEVQRYVRLAGPRN